MELPKGFDNWNPAWRGAFKKGAKAREAGEPIGACPYEDKRKWCGRLTWSRAFQACWRDGWQAMDEHLKRQFITDYYTDRANGAHAAKAPR